MDFIPFAGLPFLLSIFITWVMDKKMEKYMKEYYPTEWQEVYRHGNSMIVQYGRFLRKDLLSIPKFYYYTFKHLIHYFNFIFSNKYNNKGKIGNYKLMMRICWITLLLSLFILFPLLGFIIAYLQGDLIY